MSIVSEGLHQRLFTDSLSRYRKTAVARTVMQFFFKRILKDSSLEGWQSYLHWLTGIPGAVILLIMGHHPSDDAYITFRHSKNFADHLLLSWNLNPPYELGSTTPGLALILGFLGKIFGSVHIPYLSLCFNAFILVLLGSLIFRIARDITENTFSAFCISFLICINSYNIRVYSLGFEAALFTLVFYLCIFLMHKKHLNSAAFLAGFAPLVRPEGIFIAPIFLFFLLSRRENWKPVLFYSIIPLLYLFFSLYMYGNPVPQSIQAKKAFQYLEQSTAAANGFTVLDGFWNILIKPILLYNGEAGLKIIPDLGISLGNFFLSKGNDLLICLIIMYLLIIFKLYHTGKLIKITYFTYPLFFIIFVFYVKRVEYWYLPVLNSSLLLVLSCGFYFLFFSVSDFIKNRFPKLQYLPSVLFCIVLFLFVNKNTFLINKGKRQYDEMRGKIYVPGYGDNDEFERFLGYKSSALILNKFKPEVTLTHEVGIFGFFYKGRVIDSFGLCTREPVDFYLKRKKEGALNPIDGAALAAYIKPDFIVGMGFKKEFINLPEGKDFSILRTLDYKAWNIPIILFAKKTSIERTGAETDLLQ